MMVSQAEVLRRHAVCIKVGGVKTGSNTGTCIETVIYEGNQECVSVVVVFNRTVFLSICRVPSPLEVEAVGMFLKSQ